ncbi:hypothetical protein KK083_21415 [Fulvivirgaceae bacterium PWU4]|uniref:STAS/SEC14 domain-containing protein n=1 Tax=Chryseosolibacter histidini TaxID=2782349 RepID=A0AAP2GKM6_9BACT|nr:hypothetical protein [Chryseosolibacter histidini]MBT1699471.1 hypothetical protein [Chryseosolibacter histidini]
MNRVNLMQTPYVTIFIDAFNGIVVAKWTGFLTLEEVRAGCGFMTHLFKDLEIKMHMSEHRDLGILSLEVQNYLVRGWFPEIENIGVRKVGAVVANDVFAEATVRRVNSEASNRNLTIRMFTTTEDCVQWLLTP